jgi:hypothetical protein
MYSSLENSFDDDWTLREFRDLITGISRRFRQELGIKRMLVTPKTKF